MKRKDADSQTTREMRQLETTIIGTGMISSKTIEIKCFHATSSKSFSRDEARSSMKRLRSHVKIKTVSSRP